MIGDFIESYSPISYYHGYQEISMWETADVCEQHMVLSGINNAI